MIRDPVWANCSGFVLSVSDRERVHAAGALALGLALVAFILALTLRIG